MKASLVSLSAIAACLFSAPAGGQPAGPGQLFVPAAPNLPGARIAPAAPKLRGAFVYVYSFLDLRESNLGSHMLDQLDQQLVAELASADVGSKVLRFKQTPTGRNYTPSGLNVNVGPFGTKVGGSFKVPVRETIVENAADERATGARYRLIAFPSTVDLNGRNLESYSVHWELIDAQTGAELWSDLYRTRRVVWFVADEDANGRAKAMVDWLMGDLIANGLL